MAGIAWPDIAAPALFLACWVGYSRWADRGNGRPGSLMAGTAELRRAWMRQMLAREVRIVDTQIVSVLVHAIAFFASSVVLVIGSGVAMLGARDKVMDMIGAIPFAEAAAPGIWKAKVLLLVVVFVYAFFKFTWSLRQFNYVVIMIGAAPPPGEAESPAAIAYADRTARVATRAAGHFNKAMRTYYFGLAALSWFVHPYLLMALTVAVVLVVYRREFRSRTLETITASLSPRNPT